MMSASSAGLAIAGLVTVFGAIGAVLCRDVMRTMLSLAAFLLGLAGVYAYLGFVFLAAAQVFAYAGGVLVLMVFAVMTMRRAYDGKPVLESRHDIGSAAVAAGVGAMLFLGLRSAITWEAVPVARGATGIAGELLGPHLVAFEAVGVLLLVALIAVVVIVKGGDGA